MEKVHRNRDKRGVIEDLSVVRKEAKRVNRVDQWCIVLCQGTIIGM